MISKNYKVYNGSLGFNLSELVDFVNSVSIKTENFAVWLEQWLKEKGKEIMSEVVARNASIAWDTGYMSTHWKDVDVLVYGNKVSMFFENEAYYSGWVEYGHAKPYKSGAVPGSSDWVEGRFVLTVPLQQFIDDLPKEFESAFWDYVIKTGK